jgi:hypothetical protein
MTTTKHYLYQEFQNFMQQLLAPNFQGSLSNSLYENCAILASSLPQELKNTLFKRLGGQAYFDQLLMAQAADGSWREDTRISYLPDALISTSSVLLVILTNDLLPIDHQIVQKAAQYISENVFKSLMLDDMKKTIGFESILMAHINRLIKLGLSFNLDQKTFQKLNLIRDEKLQHKLSHLYELNLTIHSILDAFSDKAAQIDWQRLSQFQEPNGSMGIYISSTVQLLENLDPETDAYQKGIDYLLCCINTANGPSAFAPSDSFETWWAFYMLSDSPLGNDVGDILQSVDSNVPNTGVAVTGNFSLPDVDTTAMKIATLSFLGKPVDVTPLTNFFDGRAYQCYRYENRFSPSANIHALVALLNALETMPQISESLFQQFVSSLEYLLSQLQSGHFHDKWHLSDLYTTCHGTELFVHLLTSTVLPTLPVSMQQTITDKLEQMIEYILSQYNNDGSFGEREFSTVEETAYAVSALIKTAQLLNLDFDQQMFTKAQDYLLTHTPEMDIPLWLGKTLYKSWVITQAGKLSALAWIDAYLDGNIVDRKALHT